MLPKNNKIDSNLIPRIAKKGKRVQGEGFDFRLWYDDELSEPKFAVVVPLKAEKRAAKRNRIRRLFKAAFLKLIQEKNIKPANYFVIVRDSSIAELKMYDVYSRLEKIL